MKRLLQAIISHIPLAIVVSIACYIAWKNILPGTHYAGWDNILAEFDLARYARQVLFGAWLEHQGLGAPAAQGHLSEIPRLPILFFFKLFLPDNLIRYAYIFSTYLLGGVGMYFYIRSYWFKLPRKSYTNWLAGLGGVLYLLHILTLQQFYISFEMFMAQFAFLPFVLMTIHRLFPVKSIDSVSAQTPATQTQQTIQKNSKKQWYASLLLFIFAQLLIAPSGHTSTIFYLAVLFTQLYGFMLHIPTGLLKALRVAFLIGLFTFLSNSYWIIPNLYYSVQNAHYVSESRNNRIFGPESVWSIREAGTWDNFLKGTHYLFSWKDYSFANEEFDLIFNEWESHLQKTEVAWMLRVIGIVTIVGGIVLLFSKKTAQTKWAVIATYIGCTLFIWIDLFPTNLLFDVLYQSDSFLEAFRNPFTKLSILYSFVSVLLFVSFFSCVFCGIENVAKKVSPKNIASKVTVLLSTIISIVVIIGIVYSALPSFQGHFISEKLRIIFPDQYTEMYDFFKTQDRSKRVLQLPQHSHAGWEYYDWQFLGKGNGYQGMGFYFFGFPQSFLNRDSDRWVETSDFFYHELKYALDTGNSDQLKNVLEKYAVDFVIIDETKIDPNVEIGYAKEHALVKSAGLELVWKKDFLSVYEITNELKQGNLLVPTKLTQALANTNRVRFDSVFAQNGHYVGTAETKLDSDFEKSVSLTNFSHYPFANLATPSLDPTQIEYSSDNTTKDQNNIQIIRPDFSLVSFSQFETQNQYFVTIPGITGDKYYSSVAINVENKKVSINFPQTTLQFEDQEIEIPQLSNQVFELAEIDTIKNAVADSFLEADRYIVFFNEIGVILQKNQTAVPTLEFSFDEPIEISIAAINQEVAQNQQGFIDIENLNIFPLATLEPDWETLAASVSKLIPAEKIKSLKVVNSFSPFTIDLTQNPSVNCSLPQKGSIETLATQNASGKRYLADKYAVNCNGYNFDYVSPAGEYIMRVKGSNTAGRGTKLFLNYIYPKTMPEDYLLHQKDFDLPISIHTVSNDVQARFHLNWETRSFGKQSSNDIESIQLYALPLARISQIVLEPQINSDPSTTTKRANSVQIHQEKQYFDSLFYTTLTCKSELCTVGLNQTYDSGWFGFQISDNSLKILSHLRLNNWANAWEIPAGSQRILFIYVPELVQFLFLAGLSFASIVVSIMYVVSVRRKK